jgi:glycosyltransferase involved in cell wall biosynthesis
MEGAIHKVLENFVPCRTVVLVSPSPPPYGGMALQAGLLGKLLRVDGFTVRLFPSNFRLPGPLERVPGLRTLARLCMIWWKLSGEARGAAVVHVFAASWAYFFLVVWPSVVVGRYCGAKVILNYRGGEGDRFFKWFGWAVWPAFRLASVVTVPSAFLGGILYRRFGIRALTVSNILDLSRFQYRERSQFRPRLLVTRHLEKMYDVESVLKAFRLVQSDRPSASLWIAGTGSQSEHLKALAAAWDLKNVRFLGHVAHQDLPRIYDECDILLNGSRIDNFPAALLEGSSAGLVVVSTCAGGIPFVYQDQENAILVERGDWRGLARGVEHVLDSPSFARSLAESARLLAKACDWHEVRRSLYTAYGFPVPEVESGGASLAHLGGGATGSTMTKE